MSPCGTNGKYKDAGGFKAQLHTDSNEAISRDIDKLRFAA